MNRQSNSPLLSDVLFWVKKSRMSSLRTFFALDPYLGRIANIRFSARGPEVLSLKSTLDKRREEICADLVEPLFDRPGLEVRFEANCRRHRRDNAYSCVEFYRNRLEKIRGRELECVLEEFRSDWQRALPGARFPFAWMIEHRDPVAKEQAELDKRLARFDVEIRRRVADAPIQELDLIAEEDEAMRGWTEIQNKDLAWAQRLAEAENEIKRQYVLDVCKEDPLGLLWMMKWARGKPGRHPKEFNVLVYHIIKKCTRRKFDKNRKPIMRKDGQHRLATDWKLAIFLLLDLHVHTHEFPRLARFVSRHKRKPADVALRALQAWLLDVRKNFPAIHGWPTNKEGFPEPETGFRKLIVTADGGLKAIHL